MEAEKKRTERYYVEQGKAHDDILRCKDCSRLITYQRLSETGCCKCGNKRVTEVTTLNLREWFRIKFGLLRFPDSDKFLKEFGIKDLTNTQLFWAVLALLAVAVIAGLPSLV